MNLKLSQWTRRSFRVQIRLDEPSKLRKNIFILLHNFLHYCRCNVLLDFLRVHIARVPYRRERSIRVFRHRMHRNRRDSIQERRATSYGYHLRHNRIIERSIQVFLENIRTHFVIVIRVHPSCEAHSRFDRSVSFGRSQVNRAWKIRG